jgi:hypothetical protein
MSKAKPQADDAPSVPTQTLRVRLGVAHTGPGGSLYPGDEADFPLSEATRMISAGYAVPVVPSRAAETR